MPDGTVVKIERLNNGYEIEMDDPAIVEQNAKRDSAKGPYKPWKNPKVGYVFKSVDEVLAFLKKNLDKALPMDEYGSAFDAAAAESDDD